MKFAFVLLFFLIPQLGWQTYVDSLGKFKIAYPDDWITKNNHNSIVFISPKENDNDSFQENVNIILQDLSNNRMTLDQYTSLTEKQVQEHLGSSAIKSIMDRTLAGVRAKELIFDMNYKGANLKVRQDWFIKNNIAYLFTYTAETSQYDGYSKMANQIVASFKFL